MKTPDAIVDAHVHIYPQQVAADPAGWAAAQGEPGWAALVVNNPGRRVRQGWADCGQLLRDMDAAGVDRAILLGWYWERQETCEWHNRYYADCISRHGDRLSAFATLQAAAGDRALLELEWAVDKGFCGLGELCPHAVGGAPVDENWLAVFHRAVELGWPVNLHVTDPAGPPYAGRVETPLESIVTLGARLPRLKLVLSHWGGGLLFHELNPYCKRALANAVYDSSASPVIYDPGIFQRAVDLIGPDRILFGSDYPLIVFPSVQAHPDLLRVVHHIRSSGLDRDELSDVLGRNALRLLSGVGSR